MVSDCFYIFQPDFVCGALQTLVQICFYHIFHKKYKKGGKANKLRQTLSSLHPNSGEGFYSQTGTFFRCKNISTDLKQVQK